MSSCTEGLKKLIIQQMIDVSSAVELEVEEQCEIIEQAHILFKKGSEEVDRKRRENLMEINNVRAS